MSFLDQKGKSQNSRDSQDMGRHSLHNQNTRLQHSVSLPKIKKKKRNFDSAVGEVNYTLSLKGQLLFNRLRWERELEKNIQKV